MLRLIQGPLEADQGRSGCFQLGVLKDFRRLSTKQTEFFVEISLCPVSDLKAGPFAKIMVLDQLSLDSN